MSEPGAVRGVVRNGAKKRACSEGAAESVCVHAVCVVHLTTCYNNMMQRTDVNNGGS